MARKPDEGADETVDEAVVAAVADDVRAGPFVRRCLALAAWVGPQGRPVTGTGLLQVAAARAAYEDLGLVELSAPAPVREQPDQPSLFGAQEEEDLAWESPLVRLRSAADLPALHQLWQVGVRTGLIEIDGAVARTGQRSLATDEDWALLGIDLGMHRLLLEGPDELPMYAFALRPQAGDERAVIPWCLPRADGTCSRRDLTKAWWNCLENPLGRDSASPTHGRSDRAFRAALEVLADLGVCRLAGDEIQPTEWGRDLSWLLNPKDEDVQEIVIEIPEGWLR